ncbi:MAG: hypothetical protein FWH14_02485 [Oscillospiraceae bacterium]|nr:hypothetical protein [Oscillospiraceae bacterium]
MKSSVYISSEKIRVIGYIGSGSGISVQKHLFYDLPEGSVISGKITNESNVIQGLMSLKSENSDLFEGTELIIDGNSITTKIIEVPRLSKKQYYQLIRDDFSDTAANFSELVFDYSRTSDNAILGCAAERSLIAQYTQVFKNAGISLKSIRIGVEALIKYAGSTAELKGGNYLLNVIDGFTMLSMVFSEGVNLFMSRTRLYGEDRKRVLQGVVQNLSGMKQFTQSENIGNIEDSYYLGLSQSEVDTISAMNPYSNIKISALNPMSGGDIPPEAHFACINAMAGDNRINLIESMKNLDRAKRKIKPANLKIPAAALFLAIIISPLIYSGVQILALNAKISEINRYLFSSETLEKSYEIDTVIYETAGRTAVKRLIDQKNSELMDRPLLTNYILDLVTTTRSNRAQVLRIEFNEIRGVLRINARSNSETDAGMYVEELKQSENIKSVTYTGYSGDSEGRYDFSIEILLTSEREKQEIEEAKEEIMEVAR